VTTRAVRHVVGRALGRGYEGLVPVDKARRATGIEMHASRHRVSRARWAENSPGLSVDATSRRQGHRVLFPCSADRIPRPGPCFSFSPVGCRHELEARCPGLQQKLPQ